MEEGGTREQGKEREREPRQEDNYDDRKRCEEPQTPSHLSHTVVVVCTIETTSCNYRDGGEKCLFEMGRSITGRDGIAAGSRKGL